MARISWDEWFLDLADVYAKRATCNRLSVGCVIAKGNIQLAEGYNGSIAGDPHCTDVGCLKNDQGRCIRTIHAEQNAILNAMKKGVNIEGATAYVTHECCETCTKLLAQAGIVRVVFRHPYENPNNKHFNSKMEWEHFNKKEVLS